MATDVATQTPIEGRLMERIRPENTQKLTVGGTGLVVKDMAQLLEFARIMAVGGVSVPKYLRGNPGACVAITLNAVEWGFSPFNVANKSYSVNDRIGYEAQLIHAVILKRAPIKGRPRSTYTGDGAKRQCLVSGVLSEDGSTVDYLSPEIGKIPIQNSPLWKNDPDQQLHYYSVRAWCRRHFPDIILGVMEREEAQAEVIDQPPPAQKTLQNRLEALAADPEDPDDEDDETKEDEDSEDFPEEDDLGLEKDWQPLMVAARKGPKALRFALGRLSDKEVNELGHDRVKRLEGIADYVQMKTGESKGDS